MDFEFFEYLTPDEALLFKNEFLENGRKVATSLHIDGKEIEYTAQDVDQLLRELSHRARYETDGLTRDQRVPVLEFDRSTRREIVAASYMLGETIRLAAPDLLEWDIGEEGTAIQMQPVVTGFPNRMQLSPMLVTENIIRRMISGHLVNNDIPAGVINHWLRLAKSN